MKHGKWIALALLLIGIIAQLGLPAWMIGRHEYALKEGKTFRFAMRAYDPADPLRGRYIRLNFETVVAENLKNEFVRDYQYFELVKDEEGFAEISEVSREKPFKNRDWLYAKSQHFGPDGMRIVLPFDRYFMNEKDAPIAEDIFRERLRPPREMEEEDQARDTYAEVKIFRGTAVITGVVIDGKPLEKLVEERR